MSQRKRLTDFDPTKKLSQQLEEAFAAKPKMIKTPPPTEFHPVAEFIGEALAARNQPNPSQMLITSFIRNLDKLIRPLDVNNKFFANQLVRLLNRKISLPDGSQVEPYPSVDDLIFLKDTIEAATGNPVDASWYTEFNIPAEQVVEERLQAFQEAADEAQSDYDRGFFDGYMKALQELKSQASNTDGTTSGNGIGNNPDPEA